MKRFLPLFLMSIVLSNCATFKELEPDPPLSPAERGYIELKDGGDNFELDKGGKYFIRFPRPERDQHVLLLKVNPKRSLGYFLTTKFDDGKGEMPTIDDQTAANDSTTAYFVNTTVAQYYWVIDNVASDLTLSLRYRYLPQWRFAFENKYTEYKEILSDNTVDRATYNSIDRNFSFSGFPFSEKVNELNSTSGKIRGMRDELAALEKIFPSDIAGSRDTAYQNFISLRDRTRDELQFQENYARVLSVFKAEQESQGNMAKFLESAGDFADFTAQRSRFPQPIVEKATDVFSARMAGATEFYDDKLRAKNDSKKAVFTPSFDDAKRLYDELGSAPADFKALAAFIDRYNVEAAALQSANEKFRQIDNALASNPPWTSDGFWADLIGKVGDIRSKLPDSRTTTFSKFGGYACARALDADIRNATARANASDGLFRSAQQYAQQLNINAWGQAEDILRGMHTNYAFTSIPAVNDQKVRIVRQLEDELFSRVKRISQERVDAFVKANEAAIDNVAQLYLDSAFTPVHQIGFASAGEAEAQRRRAEVQDYIDKLKFNDFPAASIRAIYRDFTQNINNRGVERARAIVEHGKYYKGDDKQLKAMVDECNPWIAKWIVKPKEYRKQYVLPITNSPRGVNEYVFRVLLRIPSEAQFPVFEINVKLPKEVAENAHTQSWYESIKINKTPIKNEGRFTITAPTPESNYESQISPVQMDKAGNNVLEIRFKHNSFKVFEVSTMAQVPIIRKN